MKNQIENDVDTRTQLLFKLLVERYIAHGTPVASKSLASNPEIGVSAATIRNIMGELEEQGYVQSPHASAGKIPTSRGLRFFVDSLLAVQPLKKEKIEELEGTLNPDMSPRELIYSASDLLSHTTRMACLITTPKQESAALRQVDFLPLSGDRVLVILVLNDREVQNKVIRTDREYGESELNRAANYLNCEFAGRSLIDIRQDILLSMQSDKDQMDKMIQASLDFANLAFVDSLEQENHQLIVTGETNLIDLTSDLDAMRGVLDTFSRKAGILHLLDQCAKGEGTKLFIGEESGYKPFDNMSLVAAPYEVGGHVAGVLGVVGPTRMDYKDIIPVVDVTAKVLSAAMN